MKRMVSLAAAFLLGLGMYAVAQNLIAQNAMAQSAAAPKIPDAVVVDPNVHNVILENEHVRVFEGRASHGAKSPMHSHPPFLLVSVGSVRAKLTMPDGKTAILDLRPGQVLWLDGAQHSWELLSGELHAIGVEVKSAAKAAATK